MKLHFNEEDLEFFINIINERTGVREDVLEKDYYVTLMLKELAEKEYQNYSYFKGGTALYKGLKSIRRFSEDIDLTVYVDNCMSNTQKRKRLRESALGYESLKFKEKKIDNKFCLETIYQYNSLFQTNQRDALQRFGVVKIESTSFTISEPVEFVEIAPHLYELANSEEREILEKEFDVKPFCIATITLERIFIDKVFAAEFYYLRGMLKDFTKHIYDLTVMINLDRIKKFLENKSYLNYVINLKRKEENRRIGGIKKEVLIKNFEYLNDVKFYMSSKFKTNLAYIHNTYVLNNNDIISINEVLNLINLLKNIFEKLEKEFVESVA